MQNQARMLGVDSLRGVAALSVLVYHFTTRFDELYGHPGGIDLGWPHGGYGVSLFFVISGLVIYRTLDRASSVRAFLWNRASRLYPAYWAAVLLTFVAVGTGGLPGRETSLGEAAANLTMVQTAFGVPHVDGVYWSLYVELMFYGLLAVLYGVGARWLAATALGSLAFLHLLDIALPLRDAVPGWWRLDHLRLIPYAHLFLAGILIHKVRESGWNTPRIGTAILVVAVIGVEGLWGGRFPGHAPLVMGLVMLVWLATGPGTRWLEHRTLLFLGTISYSLYLVHQNVGYVLLRWGYAYGVEPIIAIPATALMVVGLATALCFMVERPALAWLRARRVGMARG